MKRYLFFLSLILLLAIFQIPSAFACSWEAPPPPTLDEMLERDVLVRGIIMENNLGNSILYVERYLQGAGPRYLFIFTQPPLLHINSVVRGYDYGCGGATSAIQAVGTRAYFSLKHQDGGYYTTDFFSQINIIDIVDDESGHYVEYYQNFGDSNNRDDYKAIHVSETDFETIIADMVGHRGTIPDRKLDYPRFRKLYITTESGQHYMMPIDSHELVLLDEDPFACEEACPIASPDRTHFAIPIPVADDTYALWYRLYMLPENWYDGWDNGVQFVKPSRFTAQEILFSQNSDYFLAWNDAELTLYRINNWEANGPNGRLPTISASWQTELATDATWTSKILSGQGAWSQNSRAFAYWDAEGLKWMDLTTMREPRPIVPSFASMPVDTQEYLSVLELSITGRYIRFGTEQEWSLYDTLNDHIFDDVLVNPDETALFALSPEDVAFEFNRPYHANVPDSYEIVDSFWVSDNIFIVMACTLNDKDLCYPFKYRLEIGSVDYDSVREVTPTYTNAYAFDNVYGEFAWAFDAYTIRFKLSRYDDGIDFSEQLDSPIASLEWGSQLWYVEN